MTDKEILQKVVIKAQQKGYNLPSAGIAWDLMEGSNNDIDPTIISFIIFSHDFAKALWAYEKVITHFVGTPGGMEDIEYQPAWEYHLQKMIICNEPLKYLEKFL